MNPQAKKKQKKTKDQHPYSFSDEATQKKIKKHLTDIKDVITEKDIADAKVPGKENDPVAPAEKQDMVTGDTIASSRNKTITRWETLEE